MAGRNIARILVCPAIVDGAESSEVMAIFTDHMVKNGRTIIKTRTLTLKALPGTITDLPSAIKDCLPADARLATETDTGVGLRVVARVFVGEEEPKAPKAK